MRENITEITFIVREQTYLKGHYVGQYLDSGNTIFMIMLSDKLYHIKGNEIRNIDNHY